MSTERLRLCYLSILGEPGTYDPSVYDAMPGGDDECRWIQDGFGDLPDLDIVGARVSHGDTIPGPDAADAFILGGSYNSVHDDYLWQRELLAWFHHFKESGKPLLGICGGHQLISRHFGADVIPVPQPPVAGTLPVTLTTKGATSPLFDGVRATEAFHFANYEQVAAAPNGARILAQTPDLPVAALDYGGNWYSVQFHPEASVKSLAMSWAPTHPEIADRYSEAPASRRIIENFLAIARG